MSTYDHFTPYSQLLAHTNSIIRHTTSISTTFTWSEWHTILTLSTLWHFNYLRKLAITHLEPYHSEPIELVKAGRAAFIPSWVLAGYKKLVTKPDAISEKESGAIGHLTVVRLYIIRHSLQQAKGRPELCDGSDPLRPSVGDILLEKFKDQFGILRVEELARRTKEEIERDELITAEAEQVKKKEQEQEQEEKGRQRKEKSEERRRCVEMMRLEEDEKMRLEVMRRHTEEDEGVRLEAVKRRTEEDKMMLLEQKDRSPQEIKNMQLEVEIQRAIEDKRSQFEQEKRRAEEHEKMRVEVEKRRGEEDEETRLEVENQLEEEDQRTRLGTKRAAKRERMERIRARRVVELELAC